MQWCNLVFNGVGEGWGCFVEISVGINSNFFVLDLYMLLLEIYV